MTNTLGASDRYARTPTQIHARECAPIRTQINNKEYALGSYKVEADAAAARDMVAKVLGRPLNFEKPRKITGERSKGADMAVADAIKAAKAFVLGTCVTWDFECIFV